MAIEIKMDRQQYFEFLMTSLLLSMPSNLWNSAQMEMRELVKPCFLHTSGNLETPCLVVNMPNQVGRGGWRHILIVQPIKSFNSLSLLLIRLTRITHLQTVRQKPFLSPSSKSACRWFIYIFKTFLNFISPGLN